MKKGIIAVIAAVLTVLAAIGGRAVLAATPTEPSPQQSEPSRFGTDKSHTFSTEDRFVLSTVVSERVLSSITNGPCRLITTFCLLENHRVRQGHVVGVQSRPQTSTDLISMSLGSGDQEYTVELAPAAGHTWGTVASGDDLVYFFGETP